MYTTFLILSAGLAANALPTTQDTSLQALANLYFQHPPLHPPHRPLLSTPQPHPSNTIRMKSTQGDITSLTFTTSLRTCTSLKDEIGELIGELGYDILDDHPNGVFPSAGNRKLDILESISFLKFGSEYRVSLEISVSNSINVRKWIELIALLVRTAMAIVLEREDIGLVKGVGRMGVEMELGEVGVQAWWTFYEVVDGVAVECREGAMKEVEGVEGWDLKGMTLLEDPEKHGDL